VLDRRDRDALPRLRPLPRWTSALPAQPGPLIGREADLRFVCGRLRDPDVRLVTLTGPAGVGKTRLAIRAAEQLSRRFTDGCCFIDLAPITDPDLMPAAIAQRLGLRDRSGTASSLSLLIEALQDSQVLLVLDNFEQILPAAPTLATLLTACPSVSLLVTSRTSLNLRWDHELSLAPLATPLTDGGGSGVAGANRAPRSALDTFPAVRLFLERAAAVRPDFKLTEENAPILAAICARLDGLPLAIELAAAWLRTVPPHALLTRLESTSGGLDVLVGGPRDLPERQRALRTAIDSSYERLSPEERALFRRLSVFAGGCTLDAAAHVMNDQWNAIAAGGEDAAPSAAPALELLNSLVAKSLLRTDEGVGGESRFRMLETVRQYARERLIEAGEQPAIRRAHAHWCLALAETEGTRPIDPDHEGRLARLAEEHDNLRAALDACLNLDTVDADERCTGARIAVALVLFWHHHGHLQEGRRWLGAALTFELPPAVRAGSLRGLAFITGEQGDIAGASGLLEEAIAISRREDDHPGLADALNRLGLYAAYAGDYARAHAYFDECLAVLRAVGDKRAIADVLVSLALTYSYEGNDRSARPLLEECLALYETSSGKDASAWVLRGLGMVARAEGDYPAARRWFGRSLAGFRAQGGTYAVATVLMHLAITAHAEGKPDEAATLYAESLRLNRPLDNDQDIALCYTALAHLAVSTAPAQAARLLGAGESLRGRLGIPLRAYQQTHQGETESLLAAALGEDKLAAERAAGNGLSPQEAFDVAIAVASSLAHGTDQTPAPPLPTGGRPRLTARQAELLCLVAAGLTNREIAATLSLSLGTIERHLANVYLKLHLSGRAAAAAYAVSHGLVASRP
jgi:predicted ATPase/DNA-binding CsgD family transcriptional regulator